LAVVFTLLFAVNTQTPESFAFHRGDWAVNEATSQSVSILSGFPWLTSLNKYTYNVQDPGTVWSGNLILSNLVIYSSTISNSTIVGVVNNTLNAVQVNGTSVVTLNVTYSYTAQLGQFTTVTGVGYLLLNTSAFLFTRNDSSNGTPSANLTLTFNTASANYDAAWPATNQLGIAYTQQLINNITALFPVINTDVQAATNTFFTGKVPTTNFTLTTQFPVMNFTYNNSWTSSPNYTSPTNTSNGSVVYSMMGNSSPQAIPAKSNGFLQELEEEVNDVPVFDPTKGSRQILLSTPSIFFNIISAISSSNKFFFNVNNTNKMSGRFNVDINFLASIYPGILVSYPRDAAISVNASVSNIALSATNAGSAVVTFTVTDAGNNVVLAWYTTVNFVPLTIIGSSTLNWGIGSISQQYTTISQAPFGFVDASTLENWIDDAFVNYATSSWKLYKQDLDFSSMVGASASYAITNTTILIAGN